LTRHDDSLNKSFALLCEIFYNQFDLDRCKKLWSVKLQLDQQEFAPKTDFLVHLMVINYLT
jgi:hypothetical protein